MSNGWRALRLAAGLGLREAAKLLSMSPVRLGELEREISTSGTLREMDRMAEVYGQTWDSKNPRKPMPWETVNAEPVQVVVQGGLVLAQEADIAVRLDVRCDGYGKWYLVAVFPDGTEKDELTVNYTTQQEAYDAIAQKLDSCGLRFG